MDDLQIIELYWARSETAIAETAHKYGPYCRSIARRILRSEEDSEECVNDTYWKAWEAMPPQRPRQLRTFLGRITRNLALNRWEKTAAEKRGGGQVPLALEELTECVPAPDSVERAVDDMALTQLLNEFLGGLSAETRRIFLRRYWYFCSVKEIAADFGISESKVKTTLFRTRNRLKQHLEKEGVML